jgi:hypothetical protein
VLVREHSIPLNRGLRHAQAVVALAHQVWYATPPLDRWVPLSEHDRHNAQDIEVFDVQD